MGGADERRAAVRASSAARSSGRSPSGRRETLLAEVQAAWPEACGAPIAARAEPVAERDGRVTIACESGAWAQELELMGDAVARADRRRVGADGVTGLRFTADLARHR